VGSALREKPNSMAGSKDIGSSATMDDVAVGGYGRHAQPPVIVVARASQIKVCSRLTPGTGLTIILDRGARRAGLERIQQKSPAASSAPGANRSAYLSMDETLVAIKCKTERHQVGPSQSNLGVHSSSAPLHSLARGIWIAACLSSSRLACAFNEMTTSPISIGALHDLWQGAVALIKKLVSDSAAR
jgi:hypothetical protein